MLNQMILDNQNLIYSIIHKYTYFYDKEDLFQTGVIGLMKAYNNYDANMNTKFSTYAYTYILSEVLAYINANRNIKLGREYQKLYKKINEAKTILTQRLMKEPSTYELSLFLEIDEQVIIHILEVTGRFSGLDEIVSKDGKSLCLLDTISRENKDDMIDNLILKEEIDKLSDDEKKIIWMRYYDDRTQQEVANMLGTNQVHVSRSEKRVLQRLRNNLKEVA